MENSVRLDLCHKGHILMSVTSVTWIRHYF